MKTCLQLLLLLAIASPGFSEDFEMVFKPSGTYLHERIQSKEKTIQSIAVLPPTITKVPFGWRGMMLKKKSEDLETGPISDEFKVDTAGIISDALRMRGWQVDENSFSVQAILNNATIRDLVDSLRLKHETLLPLILNRPKDISKGRYSLGEDVADLAANETYNALVFVHSYFFGPRYDEGFMSMQISLVDPHSGDILAFSQVFRGGGFSRLNREKRIDLILKEIKKVP